MAIHPLETEKNRTPALRMFWCWVINGHFKYRGEVGRSGCFLRQRSAAPRKIVSNRQREPLRLRVLRMQNRSEIGGVLWIRCRALIFVVIVAVAMPCLTGCESEGSRQQRRYKKYVARSVKAKEKRQKEYLEARKKSALPEQGSDEAQESEPGQDTWKVTTETMTAPQ